MSPKGLLVARHPSLQPTPIRADGRIQRGLTMIELMVSLAILGILISIGMPSMVGLLQTQRLSSAANELTGAVQTARTEAVRRNGRVVLCRSANGTTCATGSSWPGWIIFSDTNGDGVLSAGEELLKSGTFDGDLQVRVSTAISSQSDSIRFMSTGLALGTSETALYNARMALCIATTRTNNNVRDIFIAFGGRTTVQARSTAGICSSAPGDT